MTSTPGGDSAINFDGNASGIVESVSSAIRDEIEQTARVIAENRGSRTVETADVVAALQELGLMDSGADYVSTQAVHKSAARSSRLAYLAAISSAFTGALALGLNIWPDYDQLRRDEWTSVLAISAGLAVALAGGFFYSYYSRIGQKKNKRQYAIGDIKVSNGEIAVSGPPPDVSFLVSWREIETLLSQSLSEAPSGRMPLGQVISTYANTFGLSQKQEQQIRHLLKVRNQTVHGGSLQGIDLEAETAAAAALVQELKHRTPKTGG